MITFFMVLIISAVLSFISTSVMSYISMATPIGPWIGPTLVLLAMMLLRLAGRSYSTVNLALATSAGSLGGILATAVGFSFPTLYFLDPTFFNAWLARPWHFAGTLSLFALVAGGLGVAIAGALQKQLIVEKELPFPIGQLIYKMIAIQNQVRKAYELMAGFIGSLVFGFMRSGLGSFSGLLPAQVTLVRQHTFGIITLPLMRLDLDIWPMLLAIGFVTGHMIAIPLLVGAISKIFIADPINLLFFSSVSSMEFILAFASGMVLSGTIMGFIKLPITIIKAARRLLSHKQTRSYSATITALLSGSFIEVSFWALACAAFFYYFGLSWAAICFTLICTSLCTYEIAVIAGQIGLAPLGRFATFVMVPAMLLFGLNLMHIVLVATFVEIVGGVACDVLFGRKIAQLASITTQRMRAFQYLGLAISALSIGGIFWLLIGTFGLGPDALLCAYKAQSRQLLIQAKEFNYYVLIVGFAFGHLLTRMKINAMLVLGGLLMPLNISAGLIVGGLSALVLKNKEEWYPFWSGVFAANSLWMLLKTVI